VNGRGGWDDNMPNYLSPPQGAIPPAGDAAFEALLAGNLPPAEAPAELHSLAEAIAALSLAPAGHELAGEPTARAAYRGRFGRSARCDRSHRPRSRLVGFILRAKLAVAVAVAAGTLTSAAYADVLPAPVQRLAHRTLGAPSPHPAPPGQSQTPARPAPATPPPGQRASHPKGKPSTSSDPTAAGHATGKPSSHPSHPVHPSHPGHPAHPTHPAVKPTSHG
jgi:hypothetical protein